MADFFLATASIDNVLFLRTFTDFDIDGRGKNMLDYERMNRVASGAVTGADLSAGLAPRRCPLLGACLTGWKAIAFSLASAFDFL